MIRQERIGQERVRRLLEREAPRNSKAISESPIPFDSTLEKPTDGMFDQRAALYRASAFATDRFDNLPASGPAEKH